METTFTKRNSHGANLKRWREWRGIKQEVLADKIGVSSVRYTDISCFLL